MMPGLTASTVFAGMAFPGSKFDLPKDLSNRPSWALPGNGRSFEDLAGAAAAEVHRSKAQRDVSGTRPPFDGSGEPSDRRAASALDAPKLGSSGSTPAFGRQSRSSSSESHASRSTRHDKDAASIANSASPSRRSRSRSPNRHDNVEDEALKCFKKKFYGKKMTSSSSNRTDDASSGKYVHANFKPKGKDWKRHVPGHHSESSNTGDNMKASNDVGAEAGASQDSTGASDMRTTVRPPSRPQSSSSRHSASGLERPLATPSPHTSRAQAPPCSSPMSTRSSNPPSRPSSELGRDLLASGLLAPAQFLAGVSGNLFSGSARSGEVDTKRQQQQQVTANSLSRPSAT